MRGIMVLNLRKCRLWILAGLVVLVVAIVLLVNYLADGRGSLGVANLEGGPLAPGISGVVEFRDVPGGVMVTAEVTGLPHYRPAVDGHDPVGPHGFHLHENGNCAVGDAANPFQAAGGHWNPDMQPHGNHAGDFPVLFSHHGYAKMSFFTDRFKVADVIGKSVVIHENPDDYRTQPAGDAGRRLACGVIKERTTWFIDLF